MHREMSHGRRSHVHVTKIVVLVVLLLVAFQYLLNALFLKPQSFLVLRITHTSAETEVKSPLPYNLNARNITPATLGNVTLERCPVLPPLLHGHVEVDKRVPSWTSLEEKFPSLLKGGHSRPPGCVARHKVAIVIPFRDRDIHLKIFLNNIHPFLQKQQLDYAIFVVEMAVNVTFNRALLMNIGYLEALKDYDYQCFVFHDVDLLPEDDRNLYSCEQSPRHMSVAVDTLNYKLPYAQLFGGVSAISREHFQAINGFSNLYFGWGGEDDDMYRRILYSGLTVTRYAPTVARYKMLVHAKDKSNPDRFHLLRTTKARRLQDGVNNLKYTVLKKEYRPLYTWILVSVNVTEIQNEISHKPSGSPLVNKTNSSASSVNSIKATNETEHSKTDAKSEIQQPGANKAQLAQPAATKLVLGRLRPVRISWIPRGFVGNLPENLTKVDPLPVIETPKVAKTVEELKQQQLALREQHENKTNNIDSVNRTNEDIDPKQQVLDLLQKMHQQQQQQQQQNEQHSDQMFSQQQQQKQQQQIINSNQNDQINNENERQKQYTLLQSNFQNSLQQNSEALQVVVEQQIIDQDRESQQQTALQSNVLQIQEKQHQQQQLQHQQHQQHQQQQQQQRQPEQQEQQHHQQQQQQRQRLLSSDSIVVVTS